MLSVHPQYITDSIGNKLSVILPINEFEHIMDELEELDDVRLYDEAKASNSASIPLDEAFKLIEDKRKTI